MQLKKLLPFEKYTLVTNLPYDEIIKRITDIIDKSYRGNIQNDIFSITPIISKWERNSFLPDIKGRIYLHGGQTYIAITMQLYTFVKIFISIWLSMAGSFGCIVAMSEGFRTIPFPFVIFGFGCALTIISFKLSASESKKFLKELLAAHETHIP